MDSEIYEVGYRYRLAQTGKLVLDIGAMFDGDMRDPVTIDMTNSVQKIEQDIRDAVESTLEICKVMNSRIAHANKVLDELDVQSTEIV